jgi:hypothetical protein
MHQTNWIDAEKFRPDRTMKEKVHHLVASQRQAPAIRPYG